MRYKAIDRSGNVVAEGPVIDDELLLIAEGLDAEIVDEEAPVAEDE